MSDRERQVCTQLKGRLALCIKTHRSKQKGEGGNVSECFQGNVYKIENYTVDLQRGSSEMKSTRWFHLPPIPDLEATGGYIRFSETNITFHYHGDVTNLYEQLDDDTWVFHGTITSLDGNVYEGQVNSENGKRHGEGKYTYANGDTYEGQYQHGKPHGEGKSTYANGDTYEGQYQHDKRHGEGKYTYANGTTYEGQWQHGKRHGEGKYTYANGTTYEGQWQHDKRHGEGKLTLANGIMFIKRYEHGRCITSNEIIDLSGGDTPISAPPMKRARHE